MGVDVLWCLASKVAALAPMRAEFVSNAHPFRERARAARQFADHSKQRTAILLCSAEALLARFDELERRMLSKIRWNNRARVNDGRR